LPLQSRLWLLFPPHRLLLLLLLQMRIQLRVTPELLAGVLLLPIRGKA